MASITTQFDVGTSSWVNLGNGPLQVRQLSPNGRSINIIVSDSQPSANDIGYPLYSGGESAAAVFLSSKTVWAKILGVGSDTVKVAVVKAAEEVYTTVIDNTSTANVTYMCEAPVGSLTSAAVWRCQKIDSGSTPNTIKWAGTGDFDQIADNRTSLTYN